jgi:hypothetical protein
MEMQDTQKAVKLSLRLDSRIHTAIRDDGRARGREVVEHIQRILAEYAINLKLVDTTTTTEVELFWSLVDRAVETARTICRNGGFTPDITHVTFLECMRDVRWAADYESYVKDNPYKHGNPRKSPINKEIGFRIREGIGGTVAKSSDGKPIKTAVVGSIIQSFTPMKAFDSKAVSR